MRLLSSLILLITSVHAIPLDNMHHRQQLSKRATASKNGVSIGFLPDDGSGAGGSPQNMASINSQLKGYTAATYGRYAQVKAGQTFDGSQLLSVMDDVKQSGAIFEPAVMPTGGFGGFTSSNPSQAQAVARVMKKFTDQGITVRLRFAHEINYYLQDGTYPGGTGDDNVKRFKEAWSTMRAQLKAIAPEATMFFTPNVSNDEEYARYMPDVSEFDFCGVDWYPKDYYPTSLDGSGTLYVSKMKTFHDRCTSGGAQWAVGETGLGQAADTPARMNWLKEIVASKQKGMDKLVSVSWFQYYKDYDFKLKLSDVVDYLV